MSYARILVLGLMFIGSEAHAWGWGDWFGTPRISSPIAQAPELKPILYTLMIDPAGDVRDPGRAIGDSTEQALTMQCAQELRTLLESNIEGLRVIITRFEGEAVDTLHNASFANRIKPDLFISLHFFEQREKIPFVYFFYSLYNPSTDFWEKKKEELALIPYNQAYIQSLKKSEVYAKEFFDQCSKAHLQCKNPIGFPFKPLVGIMVPALGVEIGITRKDQWKEILPHLAKAFEAVIAPRILGKP